ncbi:MAG: trypsin-like peptidase domain-containing protein [Pseudomonadota bacterium]
MIKTKFTARLRIFAHTLSILFIYLFFIGCGFAQTTESIFEAARDYTVQIRTAVDVPFIGDKKTSSLGAGFMVDVERGWILTNAHVVARSPSQVMVAMDGRPFREATKLYVDPYLDVAIIKVPALDSSRLENARLECGDIPPVGLAVGAFGHPWGLSYTGTRGIVSGVTSKFGAQMLQTDAAINGGNSGGPLISLKNGKIVGINTARISDKSDQNTNFAVPMKHACQILSLLQKGQDPSPPDLSTIFVTGLNDYQRLAVAKTYLNTDTMALRPGDVILGVSDVAEEIHNEGQLMHALRGRLAEVGLEILRTQRRMKLTGQLQPLTRITERRGIYMSGLLIGPTHFRDNRELNMGNHALMIHHVAKGSIGSSVEIKKWDFLVSVDSKKAIRLEDMYQHLLAAQLENKRVTLVLKRWSTTKDRIYDYIERSVSIKDLRPIGSLPIERVALH